MAIQNIVLILNAAILFVSGTYVCSFIKVELGEY